MATTHKIATALTEARRLLTVEDTTTIGLLAALKLYLPEGFGWEPETLWLELERRNHDIPATNCVKLMAGLALTLTSSFYWDGFIFEKVALALDGVIPNPDALEEATTAQLAWAVTEVAQIMVQHNETALNYGHEPTTYSAVVMHREGFVQAPTQLAFAQDALDRLNPDAAALRDEVKAAWAALDKDTLDKHVFEETPVGVQLARLSAVTLHVQGMQRYVADDLALLR